MPNGSDPLWGVLSDPPDDAPRLAYADWLEENPRDVPCPQFGYEPGEAHALCARCQGRGTIPANHGEQAEFIRVQCRVARCKPCGGTGERHEKNWHGAWDSWKCSDCATDRERERELFDRNLGYDLRDRLPFMRHTINPETYYGWGDRCCLYRRGFIEAVTMPTGLFLGGEACRCRGSGRCGDATCGVCLGYTKGTVAQLFSSQPVTEVCLAETEPRTGWIPMGTTRGEPSDVVWTKCEGYRHDNDDLPPQLFELLKGLPGQGPMVRPLPECQGGQEGPLGRMCGPRPAGGRTPTPTRSRPCLITLPSIVPSSSRRATTPSGWHSPTG
jgi:hypothetical protein